MSVFLETGLDDFKRDIQGVYIDKTMLISEINKLINTRDSFVCVSRPRRFGKSIAGDMLGAYYDMSCDSRELFANMAIGRDASFEEHLNKYIVVKIDMVGYLNDCTAEHPIMKLREDLTREIVEKYGGKDMGDATLGTVMMDVYTKTGKQFVFIIDEYDYPIRIETGLMDDYLSFLNGLFKNRGVRRAIALAYMTGILPIMRDRVQSKLNEFVEYTVVWPGFTASYFGFTHEEVRAICEEKGVDYEVCKMLYDGYSIGDAGMVFNPLAVSEAVMKGRFVMRWSQTSTYEVVKDCINGNRYGCREDVMKMMEGESVLVDIGKYDNSMNFKSRDDVFAYLVHLGYLSCDIERMTVVGGSTVWCRIPNREVREEWTKAVAESDGFEFFRDIYKRSRQLMEDTLQGKEEQVAEALDRAHELLTTNLSYGNEESLQTVITYAYEAARESYTIIKEAPVGRGYADLLFLPLPWCKVPAIVVELKVDKPVGEAMKQIDGKRYAEALEGYRGDVVKVGISYSRKDKRHTCKIEGN